jgi:hypothetical protein
LLPSPAMMKRLRGKGGDSDAELVRAAKAGNADKVKNLLDSGATPFFKDVRLSLGI